MTHIWQLGEQQLWQVEQLAAFLALDLRRGDVLLLDGDLGAGKTTFARALIRAGAGDPELEVPSPTFALAQSYELPRYLIGHFDLYRLSGVSETWEIGLEQSLCDGVTLIEWPDRLGSEVPPDQLRIALAEANDPMTREVTMTASGTWSARLSRLQSMVCFVRRAGWGAATPRFLQGDASRRAYARLQRDEGEPRMAVLMDSPRQPDGPVIREGKTYSEIARLAEDVRPFVAVAGALEGAGVSVPSVLGQDLENGFLLIEDLGDRVFGTEIARGAAIAELYAPAVDLLARLARQAVPQRMTLSDGSVYQVPPMDRGVLTIEIELLIDWLWPATKGVAATPAERANFIASWQSSFDWLLAQPKGWVIRDFHSPNLIALPDRAGIAGVGVIDFQDALSGHAAYDLVSLLQDARLDVAADDENRLYRRYCDQVQHIDPPFDTKSFRRAYALLGAQRNTKILGIFARLAMRDGKPGYLAHLPRIWDYLERNLAHPDLQQLATWYALAFPAKDRHIPTQF